MVVPSQHVYAVHCSAAMIGLNHLGDSRWNGSELKAKQLDGKPLLISECHEKSLFDFMYAKEPLGVLFFSFTVASTLKIPRLSWSRGQWDGQKRSL